MARPLQSPAGVSAWSRIDEHGPESLSDAELLAIVLAGPHAGRAAEWAARLTAQGVSALRRIRPAVRRLPGALDATRARRLMAALELGRRVALAEASQRMRLLHAGALTSLLAPRIAHLNHEEFWTVVMTARLEEVRSVRVAAGGITHCSVLPREAFAPALLHAAPCVAFAHNHPSGDPRPSERDLRVQALFEDVARPLGIHVVDQMVITARGHHSAREGFLTFAGEPAAETALDAPVSDDSFPFPFTEEQAPCPQHP